MYSNRNRDEWCLKNPEVCDLLIRIEKLYLLYLRSTIGGKLNYYVRHVKY